MPSITFNDVSSQTVFRTSYTIARESSSPIFSNISAKIKGLSINPFNLGGNKNATVYYTSNSAFIDLIFNALNLSILDDGEYFIYLNLVRLSDSNSLYLDFVLSSNNATPITVSNGNVTISNSSSTSKNIAFSLYGLGAYPSEEYMVNVLGIVKL